MKRPLGLTLLISACTDITTLTPVCDDVCAVEYGTMYIGEEAYEHSCHPGRLHCGDELYFCEGYQEPDSEFCRDLAGDCSDTVENGQILQFWDERNPCGGLGVCQYTAATCIDGQYFCIPPKYYGPEVCDSDGMDENCNGLINENDPDLVMDGAEYEYRGPPETLNVGKCRAGVRKCGPDGEYLFGEIRPTQEICGNNQDDDCDGFVDEDETGNEGVAFVLVVDFSGSMEPYINSVITAICDWSDNQQFSNSLFRVLAVGMDDSWVEVTDFATATDVCVAMTDFRSQNPITGGTEFVPHAIYQGNGEWPEDLDRRVIFFTDEDAQGYFGSPYDDIIQVAGQCAEENYTVGGFVATDHMVWLEMTGSCNGWLENLSVDPQDMRDDLNDRFGSEC